MKVAKHGFCRLSQASLFSSSLNMGQICLLHSHNYPQWGMVIEGEMELTVDSKPQRFKKGDEYLVPAGKAHSAKFFQKTRVMDYFSEKNRYKPK